MCLPNPKSAVGLCRRVDVQNDLGNLSPVGIFGGRVEQANVGEQTLLIISGKHRRSRRLVGDIWIEKWREHSGF